ncbi:hypothetical protein H4683_001296 [Filibacter limicola]|uniref:Uncharacterized protein n=1 Tax=Sporosarcina limicola TaxID=34101 RepID=A0A927R2R4_9BACL|nr:hypothetical protein [Sporosarcina limicola]
MNFKKMARVFIGANIMLVMTFILLPALLINPDMEVLQSFINYINKD